MSISPVADQAGRIRDYVAVKRDISTQLMLERQLFQAQKMEAVGRLAGGVAHDYNNMLTVISGYAELALTRVARGEPLHGDLTEILAAARRSTEITRQLLAFSRQQTIDPRVLDLNEAVAGMLKMLHRLIGEDIDLAWRPGDDLCPVKVDPTQIDQILANLCLNARDAITGIGKITIETGRVTFDERYCALHPGFAPGRFALLAVSDDGCGMDEKTRERLFEPFFSTKAAGRGTGLGLATVYGIVKQNDGFINVYSELGRGTTFRIYLPCQAVGGVKPRDAGHGAAVTASGTETVLLVEDEPAILDLVRRMLENLGYRVLAADTPDAAQQLAAEHGEDIRLLITDVVMPKMNGRELEKRLKPLCPHIKTIFMSGYTANVIAHRGVLDKGVNFVQKPFSLQDLSARIRAVLRPDEVVNDE
jgi:nitrogen-specific signal transduction histidine kinase/CheY-like chemotaxis protein